MKDTYHYLTACLIILAIIFCTYYTYNGIVYLMEKSKAVILIKDYIGAFLVPFVVYLFTGALLYAKLCDHFNWD